MTENTGRNCPHCGSHLKKWSVPEGSSWDDRIFFVCFNDECSYYQKGWDWMMEQYSQNASYRYMVNPRTNAASMIPVWSDTATRERIVEEPEGEDE
ncbi:ogr/Delta-like zinc finger family protein [Thermodesulfobacteriota bacterium]